MATIHFPSDATNTYTTASSTDAVWYAWTDTTTITINCTSAMSVWVTWQCSDTHGTMTNGTVTDAEYELVRVEAQRRQADREAQHVAEMKARKLADERAEKLLVANLSRRQREEYGQHKHFTVRARSGRRFRIRQGRTGNIDVVNRLGVIEARLCAHPRESVPDADTMLAQKLWLEHDDAAFERMANRTNVAPAAAVLEPLH